jgi:hypothetical protein
MTKSELQSLLNRINDLTSYNSDNLTTFIGLLRQSIDKLQTFQQEDRNPMFDAWLNMGLQEIRREVNDRFNEQFSRLSFDKQKTEYMYSRSIVTMALTNILMHI